MHGGVLSHDIDAGLDARAVTALCRPGSQALGRHSLDRGGAPLLAARTPVRRSQQRACRKCCQTADDIVIAMSQSLFFALMFSRGQS